MNPYLANKDFRYGNKEIKYYSQQRMNISTVCGLICDLKKFFWPRNSDMSDLTRYLPAEFTHQIYVWTS